MGQKRTYKDPIVLPGGSAYLPGVKAVVTTSSTSKELFKIPDIKPIQLGEGKGKFANTRGYVPWGDTNDFPQDINTKAFKTPVITSGMLFNICLGYGQGIMPVRYEKEDIWHLKPIPVWDNDSINAFFEDNDINGYLLEQLTDMNFHFNVFPEILLNREKQPKIVSLRSKEATFSRWDAMNPKTGMFEYHYYSAQWGEKTRPTIDEVELTKVLDSTNPLRDLKIRMGLLKDIDGNTNKPKDEMDFRYIIPINFPTPGKLYYQKAYWLSIIESGWFDFALKIPEFKNALLANGMTIKYHIELTEDYFKKIFKAENVQDAEAQKARVKKEYQNFNKFLSDPSNTGKSTITYRYITPDGKEVSQVKITVIDDKFKGGEYLEDSEEVSNIMSYGMNVHPSVIGSAPGKNGTINGTEARELFLIKQALVKPIRDRLLRPLYIIKAFNNWPKDIYFEIPDIKLVTLDKNPNGKQVAIGDNSVKQ